MEVITAVKNKDAGQLRRLITEGADVNVKESGGNTALIWAAIRKSPECTQILINANCGMNITNQWGSTALMACFTAAEVSKLLIEANCNLNTRNKVVKSKSVFTGNLRTMKMPWNGAGADNSGNDVQNCSSMRE